MKYPRTVAKLTEWIVAVYPDALQKLTPEKAAQFKVGGGNYEDHDLPTYLLWMMQESETFDDREKAARWLAWVFGKIDPRPVLRIANVEEVMDLVRADKQAADEVAHPEWPRFLINIDGNRFYLPLRQASVAYDSGFMQVTIGDEALDRNGRIRPITQQEVAAINEAAEEHSASK